MSSSDFKINLQFLSQGLDEVINGFTKLKTATQDAVSGQTSLTKSSTSVSQAIDKQKPSLMQLGTSFGTVTAAGWSLYNAYDSLEKVKMASQRADTKVKTAMLGVQDAQQKLTDAITKYGSGSAEAAEASSELAVKQEQLANAQEIAAIRSEDVRESFAQFATTLPTMILSVASAGTAFQKMVTDMGGIHKITPRVTSALQAVGGGFKAILMNPIGIVLTAAAVAFTLLATNAFGVRDALNGLGKAIGDALPGLKAFLELIGGAANWFLNLINPVGEASAQLDTLGTSAGGAGTAMGETQVQVEGLGGAMVNQSDVITDVVAQHQALVTQQTANQTAYEAWKTAIETGNTELVDSYNLTGEEISKFEEQYAKEMEDSKKAAEDAAKDAYEAWKKSIEDSRKEVEKGFGVLESTFSTIQRDIATALDEGGREFKKVLNKYGLDPDNPLVMDAIVDWAVNTIDAENDITGFGLYIAQNIDQMKTASNEDFDAMVQQWVAYISEEEPKAAAAVGQWGTSMIAEMDRLLNSGEAKTPAEAFLRAIGNTLSPEAAQKIAKLFGVEFPDTTIEEFEKGKPKVETAVATNITTPIATKIADGEKDAKVKLTTLIQNAIIGPITDAKPKVETETVSIVGAFTKLVTDASAEIDKIGLAFTNIKWGDLGATVAKFGTDLSTAFTNYNWDQLGTDTTTAIVAAMKWSSDAVTELGKRANEFGEILYEKLKQYGWVKLGTDISGWLTKGITWVQTQITTLANTFGNKLGEAIKAFTGWADVGKSIWNAIAGGIDAAAKAVGGSLQGIIDWIKGGLGGGGTGGGMKTSPSPGYTKSAWTPGGPQLQGEVMFGTTQTDTQKLGAAFVTLATVISTSMKTIITQIGVFATTTKTQFTALTTALTALGTAFTTVGTTITTAMTTTNTQIGVFATTTKTQFTAVTVAITALGTSFTTLGTTVTTAMTTLNTQVGVFATTTNTQFTTVGTAITTLQTAFTTLATTVTTAMTTANTQVGVFTTTTVAQFAKVDASMKTLQTASSTLSTTISTHTKSMTTNVNNFASAMQSAMDKIKKSMDDAKKSADALKKSIDALKDKTITITTRYVTSGSPAGQHGYQGIIGAPGHVGGVKVGEGFRPELITVTPLTRGTGNHYGATMGGGFGSPGGRGGGEVINNITVVLDGRVIQRFVEKTALAGIGMQI